VAKSRMKTKTKRIEKELDDEKIPEVYVLYM
jgi:hypothetical protein